MSVASPRPGTEHSTAICVACGEQIERGTHPRYVVAWTHVGKRQDSTDCRPLKNSVGSD